MPQLDPNFATAEDQIVAASLRAQIDFADLQIKMLRVAIQRFDEMIEECAKMRAEIESRQQ